MIIGDIESALNLIEKFYNKTKENNSQKNFDKVLMTMYKLGNQGSPSVDMDMLQKKSELDKLEILKSIEKAEKKDWLNDVGNFDNENKWMLKRKGVLYVEGLIDKIK